MIEKESLKRKEVAVFLYEFLTSKCVNKKICSFPSSLRPGYMAKEVFKIMYPELRKDLRSTLIYLHSKKIDSISVSISNILSICKSKKISGSYYIDTDIVANLKMYIEKESFNH